MRLRGVRKSKNFRDKTGSKTLMDHLGMWLLKNGVINDAAGNPYVPPTPISRPGETIDGWPVNAPIKRGNRR